jgi:hypothetical protein
MAIHTADVVAPVFAAAEVVVFLAPRMTASTRLGDLFRALVLDRDDLGRNTLFRVRFAWSMARLAACHLLFPTRDLG